MYRILDIKIDFSELIYLAYLLKTGSFDPIILILIANIKKVPNIIMRSLNIKSFLHVGVGPFNFTRGARSGNRGTPEIWK